MLTDNNHLQIFHEQFLIFFYKLKRGDSAKL
jgi:hypothetical protein